MNESAEKRVIIITGGARGIGRAIADAFARKGNCVLVIADRNGDGSKATAEELKKLYDVDAEGFACDVASSEDCANLIEGVAKRHGKLDVLVNNAGITRDKLLARMTDEDWQTVLNINLNSVFYCSKAAARIMMKQRFGRIISMASVVGVMGNAGQCNYSASKAGVIGFSKSLAREVGSRGVTVNCIAPGFIATAMTDVLTDEVKAQMTAQIPLGRMGQPEDVAEATLFLASPGAAYITGAVLHVDGGMAM